MRGDPRGWRSWLKAGRGTALLATAALVSVAGPFLLPARAQTPREAEDRGRINLAWDAHESGRCREVIPYVDEIVPGSPSEAEGLWLKADCLRSLERFGEALALLESARGRTAQDWEGLVRSVAGDWAWSATGAGDYETALRVLGRGLSMLPGESSLVTFRAATAFRRELNKRLGSAREGVMRRLTTGEELVLQKERAAPPGSGWVRVYPWRGETPWVPGVTLEDWMPFVAARLAKEHRSLWVRVPGVAMDRVLAAEAGLRGLSVRRSGYEVRFIQGEEKAYGDRDEWVFRAAVEGLGVRGAVSDAVSGVVSTLRERRALLEWVSRNRGPLTVDRKDTILRLRHPLTGRAYELETDTWASSYDLESKDWNDFWSDLVGELGRAPGAFRCFCGRTALLRETLTQDPGAAQVVEKGKGYSVVLTALCPFHQQMVTADLLKEWGVSLPEAWERAKKDAGDKAWDLSFERGEEGGTRYLALRGEGASSLATRPALLLGALEAVEGSEVRGTSVQVLAPTTSSLVIVGDRVSPGKAQAAATRSLLRGARRGEAVERLGYRSTLKLPTSAAGLFEVRAVEEE